MVALLVWAAPLAAQVPFEGCVDRWNQPVRGVVREDIVWGGTATRVNFNTGVTYTIQDRFQLAVRYELRATNASSQITSGNFEWYLAKNSLRGDLRRVHRASAGAELAAATVAPINTMPGISTVRLSTAWMQHVAGWGLSIGPASRTS